jgi:hypothetical protein
MTKSEAERTDCLPGLHYEPDTMLRSHEARIDAARALLDIAEAEIKLGLSCTHPVAQVSNLSAAVSTLLRVHALMKVAQIDSVRA